MRAWLERRRWHAGVGCCRRARGRRRWQQPIVVIDAQRDGKGVAVLAPMASEILRIGKVRRRAVQDLCDQRQEATVLAPTPGVNNSSEKSVGPHCAAAASTPCRRRSTTSKAHTAWCAGSCRCGSAIPGLKAGKGGVSNSGNRLKGGAGCGARGRLTQTAQDGNGPVRAAVDEFQACTAAARSPGVGKIQDRAPGRPLDPGMRRIEESLQIFRLPMIAARFPPRLVHPLLHHAPGTIDAHEKACKYRSYPSCTAAASILATRRLAVARACASIPVVSPTVASSAGVCRPLSRLPPQI